MNMSSQHTQCAGALLIVSVRWPPIDCVGSRCVSAELTPVGHTPRCAQGNELEALCSARGLLARASDWLGFEINAMTTVKGDALRIKTLLEHVGMVQREVPGIPRWQWADAGIRTGYLIMYARERDASAAQAPQAPLQSACSV